MASRSPGPGLSRRRVLEGLGVGLFATGVASSFDTKAFSVVEGDRAVNVSVASDPDALVGLDISDAVKKNSREPLVYVTNRLDVEQTITVTVNNCADDILYNPSDESATCEITGTVAAGQTGRFDINGQKVRTVDFSIDVDSVTLQLNADRTVDVESGNNKGAIFVQKFSGLTADTNRNEWTIDDVYVKDDDGDEDLDRVEIEIQDSSATTVASETKYCGWNNSGSDTVNCKNGKAYNPGGNPDLTIQPDDASYDVTNQTYQATVFGYDVDGNFDTDTTTTNE